MRRPDVQTAEQFPPEPNQTPPKASVALWGEKQKKMTGLNERRPPGKLPSLPQPFRFHAETRMHQKIRIPAGFETHSGEFPMPAGAAAAL
jgi:hypothetical protein